jgi:copper(I)-binding protein
LPSFLLSELAGGIAVPDFRDKLSRARLSPPAPVCCGGNRYAADYFGISCALASLDRTAALTKNSWRLASLRATLSSWAGFLASCLLVFSVPVKAEGLTVADAWVPAIEAGRDVAMLVTIRNETSAPDALTRVSCPVANFYEKHTVDRGEGSPAMRPISSIPVPASSTIVLKHDAYHVMLLQIRQPLAVGEHFKCTLVFQKAGSIEAEVEVR